MDDIDLYLLATRIHKKHKTDNEILSLVWSKIVKVSNNFSIDTKLNIEIPSTKKFRALNIPEEAYEKILSAGLTHEDGHAFLFPFMRYINNIYAIAKKYSDAIGRQFDAKVFNDVENIISDIINEIIITNTKLPGHEDLPTLAYHYIYMQNINEFEKFENTREEIEKNPLKALWLKHRLTLIKPAQQEKEYFSDILYHTLNKVFSNFNIKEWIEEPDFFGLIAHTKDLFDLTNSLYNMIIDHIIRVQPQKIKNPERLEATLLELFTSLRPLNYSTTYLMLTLALYRLTLEYTQETLKPMIVDNIEKPDPPTPDELDRIFLSMTQREFLSPQTLEEIARKLLHQALLTRKGAWISQTENSGEATIPWYRYPRGKLVKSTLIKDVLEWRVRKTVPLITETKKSITSLPTNITIIIDESASTATLGDILAPLTNSMITTFDVERAIILSILLNTMDNGGENIPVNLIRFSIRTETEKHTVKSAYERIKNNNAPMMDYTAIVPAITAAVTLHKDNRENYFILLTDMEISDEDANIIASILKIHIRKSPLLIIIIGKKLPEELNILKRRNTAIINIKDYRDFKKIEDAIRTLLT